MIKHTSNPELLSDWPAGKSPREIGRKVVTNMLPRWIVTKPELHYAEDSTWMHGLKFAGGLCLKMLARTASPTLNITRSPCRFLHWICLPLALVPRLPTLSGRCGLRVVLSGT